MRNDEGPIPKNIGYAMYASPEFQKKFLEVLSCEK
jgi:hypothetical protein